MDIAQTQEIPKVALVTGAATGIGRACALQLSRHYDIWVGFNSHMHDAQEVVEKIQDSGRQAYPVHIDYTNPESIHAVWKQFIYHYEQQGFSPQLSVLVNNAGTFGSGYRLLLELEELEWDTVWNVNVTGACRIVRQFSSLLQREGLVINISSMVAHLGAIGYKSQAHYAVTKAVMNYFFHALQHMEAWQNVRFVNLLPGLVDTGLLHDHLGDDFDRYTCAIPLGELASPSAIAEVVSFLASSTGGALNDMDLLIDGGWSQKGWCRYK